MSAALYTIGFTLASFARPHLGRTHLDKYRLAKLKSLLLHTADHVPFYRDWFGESGFDPGDVRCLDDLRRIPITGKQQLRELRGTFTDEAIARDRLIEHKTSGSTGVPMSFLRSPAEERRLNMMHWRLQWMMGLRPGQRLARVKTTWEPLSARFNRIQNLARSLGLMDSRVFDCFRDPAVNYREIVRFQPHVIAGYPGALVRIARQHNPQSGALRCLRWVSCGGETLAPHQRRLLEERFGTPVQDVYGTSECNTVAWRCPQGGHWHVNDDSVLLEVCRDGHPVPAGETGEIVVTALHSRTMPIIRYAMGDLAVAGPVGCPCGSPFSTFRELRGRTIDFLILPDGRELHPFEPLNEIVTGAGDWIIEYQFVQESLHLFRLLVVPCRDVGDHEIGLIGKILRSRLGDAARLRIELVRQIPQDASGKLHFCRSDVQVPVS